MSRQFNSDQQQRAMTLIESLPWGDVDNALQMMEEALRRAMEATRTEFVQWEEELGPKLWAELHVEEFDLPTDRVQAMPCQAKLAYVARLLRSLALAYGVTTEFTQPAASLVSDEEENPNSPAALLRGLDDIVMKR